MRKSFLKTIVATAIVGATMAITSIAAMAATTTETFIPELKDDVTDKTLYDGKTLPAGMSIAGDGSGVVKRAQNGPKGIDPDNPKVQYSSIEISNMYSKNSAFKFTGIAGDSFTFWYSSTSGTNTSEIGIVSNIEGEVKVNEAGNQYVEYSGFETIASDTVTGTSSATKEFTYTLPEAGTVYIVSNPSNAKDEENKSKYGRAVRIYKIQTTTSDGLLNGVVDSKPAVVKSNGKYYAIALVSEQAATDNQQLAIVTNVPGSTANTSATTTEVFTQVTLDNTYSGYGAARFGNNADYAYAVQLSGCEGKTLQEVQDVLSLSFTPND